MFKLVEGGASIWSPGRKSNSIENLGRATLPALNIENHRPYKAKYARVVNDSVLTDTSKTPGPPYKTSLNDAGKTPIKRQDYYDDFSYYDDDDDKDYPQER